MVEQDSNRVVMSGNEAFARGALEAGIRFCSSYPGTPATEIASHIMKEVDRLGIYAEWSVNEKVALEAAAGASWAGLPAICSMKSLGLNVASDFLLNLNLSGSGNGGLVIISCDDPRGHSSSNEQDSRFYARAASIPLLEPSRYQEAKDIVPMALELSKKHEFPVIVRSTTRLSHSRGIVELGKVSEEKWEEPLKLSGSLFNIPNPHLLHRDLLEKIEKIAEEFEANPFNHFHGPDEMELLTISSGICQRYVEEALENLNLQESGRLGLVTTFPVPKGLVSNTVNRARDVLFVEETDPFLENEIRTLSTVVGFGANSRFHGKESGVIPKYGEMNVDRTVRAIKDVLGIQQQTVDEAYESLVEKASMLLVPRALTFCAGCTHRNVYWAIQKVRENLGGNLIVAGDIGCYSLGVFYNESMNTMHAMGSGIGVANGLGQLKRFGLDSKVVAVAGDSTFFHACIPALVNARHKNANLTFLILDNSTTAMTGFQKHPGSARQDSGNLKVSIERIVQAIEPDTVSVGDAADIPSTISLIQDAVERPGLNVIILNSICRLEEQKLGWVYEDLPEILVDSDACLGEDCKVCVNEYNSAGMGWDSKSGRPVVLEHICTRCGACISICPQNAIRRRMT
ncbi:MAG: thiamine pyrophosphate-dependent enzyme [Candidatus Thorarchaeota archaeon]|jgi:indolepyruvate ferredoxin oxidoreductase alpha subunit